MSWDQYNPLSLDNYCYQGNSSSDTLSRLKDRIEVDDNYKKAFIQSVQSLIISRQNTAEAECIKDALQEDYDAAAATYNAIETKLDHYSKIHKTKYKSPGYQIYEKVKFPHAKSELQRTNSALTSAKGAYFRSQKPDRKFRLYNTDINK